MKITLLGTHRGSEDAHTLRRFHKGETVDVAESLARSLIRKGQAVAAEPVKTMDDVVPELKAMVRRVG